MRDATQVAGLSCNGIDFDSLEFPPSLTYCLAPVHFHFMHPSIPLPSFEIHTARLLLRPFTHSDLVGVFQGLSDPDVIRHYGVSYATLEETREQMRWYEHIQQAGTGQWWCICLAGNPMQLIGGCGLNDVHQEHRRAEIGYWLLPVYWRQGLAAEAVSGLLRYAFKSMNLHRIGAEVDFDNHASASMLHRLGFVREGTRRGFEMKDGHPINLHMFSLLATDHIGAMPIGPRL